MSLTAARLRALNAVFDEGSYSAAARRLGMTQPAVSQAIRDLENAFGVHLFERRGRRLIPTECCIKLAPLTEEIRRLEDAILRLLEREQQQETGVLRVGLGNLMPGMSLIGAFQQRYPNIQGFRWVMGAASYRRRCHTRSMDERPRFCDTIL